MVDKYPFIHQFLLGDFAYPPSLLSQVRFVGRRLVPVLNPRREKFKFFWDIYPRSNNKHHYCWAIINNTYLLYHQEHMRSDLSHAFTHRPTFLKFEKKHLSELSEFCRYSAAFFYMYVSFRAHYHMVEAIRFCHSRTNIKSGLKIKHLSTGINIDISLSLTRPHI